MKTASLIVAYVLLFAGMVPAQNATFTPPGGTGSWSTAGSWTPAIVPNGTGFNVTLPVNSNINGMNTSVTVGTIVTEGAANFTFGNQTITVANGFTHSTGTLNLQGSLGIVLEEDSESRVSGTFAASNGAGILNRGVLTLGTGAEFSMDFTPLASSYVPNLYEFRNDGVMTVTPGIIFGGIDNLRVLNTGEFRNFNVPGGQLLTRYDQNLPGNRNLTVVGAGATLRTNEFNITTGELYAAGTLNGDATNFGTGTGGVTLSPGTAPNTVATMTLAGNPSNLSGSTWSFDIGGVEPGTQHDQVVAGWQNMNLGDRGMLLGVSLVNGFVPSPADTFTIITTPNVSGMFSNIPDGTVTVNGGAGTFDVVVGAGQVVLGNFTPVPEPGMAALLLPGAALLLLRRNRSGR